MFVYRPHRGDHPRRIARLTPVSLHTATAGEWTTNSRQLPQLRSVARVDLIQVAHKFICEFVSEPIVEFLGRLRSYRHAIPVMRHVL